MNVEDKIRAIALRIRMKTMDDNEVALLVEEIRELLGQQRKVLADKLKYQAAITDYNAKEFMHPNGICYADALHDAAAIILLCGDDNE